MAGSAAPEGRITWQFVGLWQVMAWANAIKKVLILHKDCQDKIAMQLGATWYGGIFSAEEPL